MEQIPTCPIEIDVENRELIIYPTMKLYKFTENIDILKTLFDQLNNDRYTGYKIANYCNEIVSISIALENSSSWHDNNAVLSFIEIIINNNKAFIRYYGKINEWLYNDILIATKEDADVLLK